MSFTAQYQTVIPKLAALGFAASVQPYTGETPAHENLAKDGLALRFRH